MHGRLMQMESQIEHITGTIPPARQLIILNYLATQTFAEFEKLLPRNIIRVSAGWNYEKSTFKRIYAYNDDLLTDDVDNMNLVMGTDNRVLLTIEGLSVWRRFLPFE